MNVILQDAVATSLALGAVVLLVRRIASVVRPGDTPPACASCPSACGPTEPASRTAETIVPLAVLRTGSRSIGAGTRSGSRLPS
jgi:hypothetical protein